MQLIHWADGEGCRGAVNPHDILYVTEYEPNGNATIAMNSGEKPTLLYTTTPYNHIVAAWQAALTSSFDPNATADTNVGGSI